MKDKKTPECIVCGKSIPGVYYPGEKAYCSKVCMDSAELLDFKNAKADYDYRRKRFINISWIVIALFVVFLLGVVVGERLFMNYLQTNPDMMKVCTWLVVHAR